MRCALCEESITERTQPPVMFSTTRPRPRPRTTVGAINVVAASFVDTVRAVQGARDETYYFHRGCWDEFKRVLAV